MKTKKFNKLCSLAKKVLIKYKNSVSFLAIRQLYLMRPHPVLLKEYYPPEEKLDQEIDGKNIFFRAYNLFKYIFFETKDHYTDEFNINNFPKKKCLFLSHLINENHLRKKEDFYFGSLPNFLEKKKNSFFNCTKKFDTKK